MLSGKELVCSKLVLKESTKYTRFSSGTNLQCTLAGASGIQEFNFKISGRREGSN